MRHVTIFTLAFGIATAACGNSSPSTPSETPTPGNTTTTTTYTMALKPSNERPNPVTNAEAAATGTASIVLRVTRNPSGTIVSATADFQANLQGFPAGSTITMAHIHTGDALSAGGIVVNTGLSVGEVALSGGAGAFQKSGVNVAADVAQGIVSAPGGYYFNVHSAMNPPGVLRSQLDGTGAPEDPAQKPPANPEDPYYPAPTPTRTR